MKKYNIITLENNKKIIINETSLEYKKDFTNVFKIYSVRYNAIIDFGKVENSYLKECFEILASNFKLDKDIPIWYGYTDNEIRLEKEILKYYLAKKNIKKDLYNLLLLEFISGFKAGANKDFISLDTNTISNKEENNWYYNIKCIKNDKGQSIILM